MKKSNSTILNFKFLFLIFIIMVFSLFQSCRVKRDEPAEKKEPRAIEIPEAVTEEEVIEEVEEEVWDEEEYTETTTLEDFSVEEIYEDLYNKVYNEIYSKTFGAEQLYNFAFLVKEIDELEAQLKEIASSYNPSSERALDNVIELKEYFVMNTREISDDLKSLYKESQNILDSKLKDILLVPQIDKFNKIVLRSINTKIQYRRPLLYIWKDTYRIFTPSQALKNMIHYKGMNSDFYSNFARQAVIFGRDEGLLSEGVYGTWVGTLSKRIDIRFHMVAQKIENLKQAIAFAQAIESGNTDFDYYDSLLKLQ